MQVTYENQPAQLLRYYEFYFAQVPEGRRIYRESILPIVMGVVAIAVFSLLTSWNVWIALTSAVSLVALYFYGATRRGCARAFFKAGLKQGLVTAFRSRTVTLAPEGLEFDEGVEQGTIHWSAVGGLSRQAEAIYVYHCPRNRFFAIPREAFGSAEAFDAFHATARTYQAGARPPLGAEIVAAGLRRRLGGLSWPSPALLRGLLVPLTLLAVLVTQWLYYALQQEDRVRLHADYAARLLAESDHAEARAWLGPARGERRIAPLDSWSQSFGLVQELYRLGAPEVTVFGIDAARQTASRLLVKLPPEGTEARREVFLWQVYEMQERSLEIVPDYGQQSLIVGLAEP